MIGEGHEAPPISLPAYHDGEIRRVDLADYLGEEIVVLAFYPADFNPACSGTESDLGDLDLLTMQKDVSLFAVSPDSVYSHERFATQYGLHLPLLADTRGEAADTYGVELTVDDQRLAKRAVFVIDHHGVVQYAWATDDLEEPFDNSAIKDAVGNIGGDETALERYRAGYEHYAEGRAAFTEAMAEYEDREWMAARPLFDQAHEAFNTALDHFDTAVRFAETDALETIADRSHDKASDLDHAADWLNDSADAFATGHGDQGTAYREDAQQPMAGAKALPDPPDPEKFTLEEDGVAVADDVVVEPEETDADDGYDWRKDDEQSATASLDEEELDAAVADVDAGSDDPESYSAVSEREQASEAGDSVSAADSGDSGTGAPSTREDSDEKAAVEGDTVEGDIELDLDDEGAADPPEEEPPGRGSGTGDATADEPGRREDAPSGPPASAGTDPGGQVDAAGESQADESATTDATAPAESGDTVDESPATGTDTSAGEATTEKASADADAESVELDLADPTEGEDDEEESDERENWDIPGR